MAEMSRRFNFDDFDEQIADALAENEAAFDRVFGRYPGQIGGVVTRLSWSDGDPLASPIEPVTDWPEPPDAA